MWLLLQWDPMERWRIFDGQQMVLLESGNCHSNFSFFVVDVCVEYPLNLTPIKCLLVFSKLGNCLIDWTLYRSNRKHYFRLCFLYLELYFLYLFVFSNTNTVFSVHFGCGCNVQIVYCIVVMVYYFIVLLYLMVCSCPNCKCNNR